MILDIEIRGVETQNIIESQDYIALKYKVKYQMRKWVKEGAVFPGGFNLNNPKWTEWEDIPIIKE